MGYSRLSTGICLSVLFVFGCSGADGPSDEAAGEAAGSNSAALTQASYTYFTCNATDWQPTDASRLLPVPGDVIDTSLVFEVSQPWMVSGADQCMFVTTNQLNGWGTQQTFSGGYADAGPDHNHFFVGSGVVGRFSGNSNFQVTYPALGRYRVRKYPARAAFSILPVLAAPDTVITGRRSPFPNMAVYAFKSVPSGASFQCRCDAAGIAGTWKGCTSDDINSASCGSPAGWTFQVRAVGANGDADPTPASQQ